MRNIALCRVTAGLCLLALFVAAKGQNAFGAEKPLKALFLGDAGHHHPRERFHQLQPVLVRRGIDLVWTDQITDLNAESLSPYAALILYANIESISESQEQALFDFVADGKGFIALHCAAYCFLNSAKYVELVGAQFQKHGTGIVSTRRADIDHPLLRGFDSFESWDETYVHHRHYPQDRIVLEYRDSTEGSEPWTWVRQQGKGRVFYTAWGHDDRTWGHPGFQALVERGIRWAAGEDPTRVPAFVDRPRLTSPRTDVAPFEYDAADVPFYPAGEKWGTIGRPITQMQRPLAPDESRKHFITPVGFEVELFAAEPQIGKPLAMTWDERGRLWVAETTDYPNELRPAGTGRDRIRICEDTDGDGHADKFTLFADQLSIPTSLIVARGGVIVAQAPDTLFLQDTDGDGVADVRQVLFTGWGTKDTHAGPSNLHLGPDNWIYGIVGYSGFAGTVGGEQHTFKQGFFRFRPDGSKLEFLRSTNNNSWGLGFNEEGVLFGSTANGNPSEYLPIPNRFYEAVRGWSASVLTGIADSNAFEAVTEKVRQVDHHGGFTAAAGHALYTARTYPREYWDRTAFVCEPTGHLIATFCLQKNGAGYRSRNRWNLLASDDEWSAPIAAEVGPDGNVWIIDWYNYIVQHNPTPAGYQTGAGNAYETKLRDKTHGRIYRLVYRGSSDDAAGARSTSVASAQSSLSGASPAELVTALQRDNLFWRMQAQRLLIERNQLDVVELLVALTADRSTDELGLNPGALHALWTLHGLGAFDAPRDSAAARSAAVAALRHPALAVRRAALQVLPRDSESLQQILTGRLSLDTDGQVRLAALLALAEMPASAAAANQVLEAWTNPLNRNDRWLQEAAVCAAARHAAEFLLAAAGSQAPALAEAASLKNLEIVAEHLARDVSRSHVRELLLPTIAATPLVAEAILRGLEHGWPADQPVTLAGEQEEAIVEKLSGLSPAVRGRVVALGLRWGSPRLQAYAAEISAAAFAIVQDDSKSDEVRLNAAGNFIELRRAESESADQLLALISPRTTPEFARGLLEVIGRSVAAETGLIVRERLNAITPAARPVAIRLLQSRSDWTGELLAALDAGDVQLAEISLDRRQALASHPDREIRDKARAILSRGGGLPDPDRQKILDQLLPMASRIGDHRLGKEVYKKHCAKCHLHGAEGTRIGPDLTGMAVHPRAELLTNIIDPSRSVEGNFRVYTVVTRGGKVLSGLLASETRTSIELIDSEAKKHALQRDDIEELAASSKSLMPEGFEKQISAADLVHLLEFLAQRGRFIPLDLRKVATSVSTKGMFFEESGETERLVFPDWLPRTFAGVPFQLVDPQGDRVRNVLLLYGPHGLQAPKMPKSATVPCNAPARAIHLLSGISGWGFPIGEQGSVSLIVRLHYADGKQEDHPLKNGEHFADYIRRVDVPGSQFAFDLNGRQLRYLAVHPTRPDQIREIEFVKGPDASAPIVMAVTVEAPE